MGAIFLRNYDIIYDTENLALSFVRARCDDSTLFGSFETDNRILVDLTENYKPTKKLKSETILSNTGKSYKHFMKYPNGDIRREIRRFSSQHFKEQIQKMLFKEGWIYSNLYVSLIVFLIGAVILILFFTTECCRKKSHQKDEHTYQELVEKPELN